MVYLYAELTPKEIVEKCERGEISRGDAESAIRENQRAGAFWNKSITDEECYSAIAELRELLSPEEKETVIKKLKHIFKNILEESLERARRNPKSESVTDLKLIQEIEPRLSFRLQTENGQPVAFRDGLEKQAWETAIAELKAEAAPDAALDAFLESVRKNNAPIAPDTQAPEADAETLKKEAAEIDKTLNLLCEKQKVRYSREKNQAIINCNLPDLQAELRYLVAAKKVTIPAATDINSINEFIRKHIRAKNGKSTGNLIRVQKSREKATDKYG